MGKHLRFSVKFEILILGSMERISGAEAPVLELRGKDPIIEISGLIPLNHEPMCAIPYHWVYNYVRK